MAAVEEVSKVFSGSRCQVSPQQGGDDIEALRELVVSEVGRREEAERSRDAALAAAAAAKEERRKFELEMLSLAAERDAAIRKAYEAEEALNERSVKRYLGEDVRSVKRSNLREEDVDEIDDEVAITASAAAPTERKKPRFVEPVMEPVIEIINKPAYKPGNISDEAWSSVRKRPEGRGLPRVRPTLLYFARRDSRKNVGIWRVMNPVTKRYTNHDTVREAYDVYLSRYQVDIFQEEEEESDESDDAESESEESSSDDRVAQRTSAVMWARASAEEKRLPKKRPVGITFDKCARKWRVHVDGKTRGGTFPKAEDAYDFLRRIQRLQESNDDAATKSDVAWARAVALDKQLPLQRPQNTTYERGAWRVKVGPKRTGFSNPKKAHDFFLKAHGTDKKNEDTNADSKESTYSLRRRGLESEGSTDFLEEEAPKKKKTTAKSDSEESETSLARPAPVSDEQWAQAFAKNSHLPPQRPSGVNFHRTQGRWLLFKTKRNPITGTFPSADAAYAAILRYHRKPINFHY